LSEFHWQVRVYYEDTDSGGVVYHSNYLNFFERARTEWLRTLGMEQDRLCVQHGIVFVVRSINVEYFKPAKFNDLLEVSAVIEELGKASMVFKQEITTAASVEPLTQARVRIACLDAVSFKPRPIPDFLLEEIESA